MNCKQADEKLSLYLYEELSAEERPELEAHLASCPACAQAAAELARLRAVLDERALGQPTPDLLVHCRSDLEEALDREDAGWRALVRGWFGQAPGQPAMRFASALAILVLGFSMGWTMQQRTGAPAPRVNQADMWGSDLGDMRINGITQVLPDPRTGEVSVTMNAERQVTLEGSLDDPHIQQILLYAVKSYDNPGIRHETLEALSGRSSNPSVREALLHAARHDPNPGVRLEALEAVRPSADQPEVRAALFEILKTDDNPGVRVATIDMLLEHADEEDVPALQELAREHQNPYVRLKCAKALRERAHAKE